MSGLSHTTEQVSIEIVERLLSLDCPSREDVNRIKIEVCRLHRSPTVPPNSDLLQRVPGSELIRLKPLLIGKQIRSASGVTTVAVMPKPYACPHGKCTYCPGGPEVGITVETRPDWSRKGHVDHMLSMGVTRVEIGVQTLYDDVYERIHRDHTVADVVEATQTLKDSGIKVGYHMMLGLPGCDIKRDLDAFRRIFEDQGFRPDMLKIYPCLVTPGTLLHEEWKRGEYTPYSTEQSARLIAEIKQYVPRWVRIMRIQREIPVDGIADGVKHGNLRQLVEQQLMNRGMRCHCIRCREVGITYLKNGESPDLERVELKRIDYEGSGGTDIFLSI